MVLKAPDSRGVKDPESWLKVVPVFLRVTINFPQVALPDKHLQSDSAGPTLGLPEASCRS